jgi:anti-sigma B factor antagonist
MAVRAPPGARLAGRHALNADGSRQDELREDARGDRPPVFRLDVHPERERVVVAPVGEVDLATVDRVGGQLDELVAAGFRVLVLDLRGVTFLDSTGISLIFRQCQREDVDVRLIDGEEPVSRLFDVTGLRETLRFAGPDETPPRSR